VKSEGGCHTYLTPDEEKLYDGEMGWAYQVAMRILVKLGDLYGADRLIPVGSAHISGVSYKTIGDAAIDFLNELVKGDGRVRASSTMNPSSFDPDHVMEMGIPDEVKEKQSLIIELYERMGIKPVLTCTPYYIERPKAGSHLAWAESSAVIYANSILGAWTNREGGPSALASALIGKTPNHGIHKAENRQPTVEVKVEAELMDMAEYGALGIYVGRILGEDIPLFSGLQDLEEDGLKQLGAALASSGMTPIFHYNQRGKTVKELERVKVERRDIEKTMEELSASMDRPDLVFIGCPHCSLKELETVARMVEGRKVRDDVKLWVCTSRYIRGKAEKYVRMIEASGGRVICDTCAVVTWLRDMGVESLMTNSAKTAYYAPTLNRVEASLAPLRKCIEAACRG